MDMSAYNLSRTARIGKHLLGGFTAEYLDWLSIPVQVYLVSLGITMTIQSKERLHGTLDALALKALSVSPRHGYALAKWIEDATGQVIRVEEGSLYPALYRMEKRGWIEAQWGTSEAGRKAKIYRLTATGRKQLRLETAEWSLFASAVSRVLTP